MTTATAAGRAAPPLEFPLPPCSICGEPVDYEERFRCAPCGIIWPRSGAHLYGGQWTEPGRPRCGATRRVFELLDDDATVRCRHMDAHAGSHHHPDVSAWD